MVDNAIKGSEMAANTGSAVTNAINAEMAANGISQGVGQTASQGVNLASTGLQGAEAANAGMQTANQGVQAANMVSQGGNAITGALSSAAPYIAIAMKAYEDFRASDNQKLQDAMDVSNKNLTEAIQTANQNKINAVNGLNKQQSLNEQIQNKIDESSKTRYEQLGVEKPTTLELNDVLKSTLEKKENQLKFQDIVL